MNDPVASDPTRSHGPSGQGPGQAGIATDMLRYWEPRRLVYNGVLALVVLTHFLYSLPGAWKRVTWDAVLILFVLAVMANVLYCAAYLVDWFVQQSDFRKRWLSLRWSLLALGTILAAVFAHYLSRGALLGAN